MERYVNSYVELTLSKFRYKPLRSYFTKSSIDAGLVVCELSLESLNLLNLGIFAKIPNLSHENGLVLKAAGGES